VVKLQFLPKVRPLQLVPDQVIWISLEELGRQDQLDPLLNLLRLPVLHEPELQLSSQQILERRPDLAETVFPILMQRHPNFTLEQLMVVVKIPTQELRHSRAAQQLIEEGWLDGEALGEARGEVKATLRQLSRICSPLSDATTARIQALPLERLAAQTLAHRRRLIWPILGGSGKRGRCALLLEGMTAFATKQRFND
jgi:predicted transposase YdaD